jgi:AAA domain
MVMTGAPTAGPGNDAGTGTGRESAAQRAARAVQDVLAALDGGAGRGMVVDSPPGAGKSTLVVQAAAALADAGEPVMVVAQTNEQVDDLLDRIASRYPGLAAGRLSGSEYLPSARVARHPSVTVSTSVPDLAHCPVVAGTAAKWATLRGDQRWPWAIVDEAYQMRSDMLLRVAGRFNAGLFVGDPGQLDPFSIVDTPRWLGLTWDPTLSAVPVLLRHNPGLPVHQLPVSWRLAPAAAAVVADAFYPFEPFQAGTTPGQRRLDLTTTSFARQPADEAIEMAAATGWALYELPARHTLRTDAEAAACAALAARVLERGAVAYSEQAPAGAAVTAERIAVGTAHRDQARAVRLALQAMRPGLDTVTVDTANRLQGREFDLVIVLHPLSGRRDATAFHLEAGRLCVLTSRHRHACIIVARAGIAELLDAHPATEPVHLNVPAKFPDGWEANHAILAHLHQWRVRAL